MQLRCIQQLQAIPLIAMALFAAFFGTAFKNAFMLLSVFCSVALLPIQTTLQVRLNRRFRAVRAVVCKLRSVWLTYRKRG